MTRAVPFTQAQVRRAVKAVESAGLCVRRVTVNIDGSIAIDSGENGPQTARTVSPRFEVEPDPGIVL